MLDEKDLRLDSFSTGVGDTGAVRIVHLPTGKMAECSEFPSKTMNKYFALGFLTAMVNEINT